MSEPATIREADLPLLRAVTEHGELFSLLYDCDLLPEQLETNGPRWAIMRLVCASFIAGMAAGVGEAKKLILESK